MKSLKIQNWFGIDTNTDEEEKEWSKVGRKDKAEERRKKAADRRDSRKRESATRVAQMASIGPVSMDSVNFFRSTTVGYKEAKVMAVK